MLYEIAHFIKDKLGFVWNVAEWVNAKAFALRYHKGLKTIDSVLEVVSSELTLKQVAPADCGALAEFFAHQPKEAFEFFQCHGFDEKSLVKLARRESQLMFIALKENEIVGYFFLRCFVNGKAFRGKMVDWNHQGRGIAKLMGVAMTKVATTLGVRMFGSISPDNHASLASAKASNGIKIHKTLENGYYYIEFLPKSDNQLIRGGGNS